MAQAKTSPPVRSMIQLTLTPDEADVLYDIGQRVGGDPYKSRRGLMSNITAALRGVGVQGIGTTDLDGDRRSIYFKTTRDWLESEV